jgi:hypothetical protein
MSDYTRRYNPKKVQRCREVARFKRACLFKWAFWQNLTFFALFCDFAHIFVALNIAFMGPNQGVLVWIRTFLYYK